MSLSQIEELCERMYNPQATIEEKREAENQYKLFQQSPDFLAQSVLVLQNSNNSRAQHFAAIAMKTVLTERWNQFKNGPKSVELRDWIIQFLGFRGENLELYVRSAVIHLLVRLIKLAWFVHDDIQNVADQGKKFLHASPELQVVGITILREMVFEIGQPLPRTTISVHRKTSQSFRDTCLKDIFEMSLTGLQSKQFNPVSCASLQLALACLSFDFHAHSSDDSSDDCFTVQIPAEWKNLFEGTDTLELFFDIYTSFCTAGADDVATKQCMECLVQLVSVGKGLFGSEDHKIKWLAGIMEGMVNILRRQIGLQVEQNHHEFCRLLTRMKGNYQFQQLINSELYVEWLTLLGDFTALTFKAWNWGMKSEHNVSYLLDFWARLVSAMSLIRSGTQHKLDTQIPKVVEVYLASRMMAVPELVSSDDFDDPLDNIGALKIQLEAFHLLRRCEFKKTSAILDSYLDPLAQQFEDMVRGSQGDGMGGMSMSDGKGKDKEELFAKLSWLLFVSSALLGGRFAASTAPGLAQLDGKSACKIIQLMRIQEEGLKTLSPIPKHARTLEMAFLYFMQNFRKVYIGESTSSQDAYGELTHLGLKDSGSVLQFFMRRLVTTLSLWHSDREVVMATLEIFSDFCSTFATSRLLGKIEVSSQLLRLHGSENFRFLSSQRGSRARRLFYRSLGKLLSFSENIKIFDEFVRPLESKLDVLERTQDWNEECSFEFVGLCYDLRGVLSAFLSRRPYDLTFEWIIPRYASVFLKGAELFPVDHVVAPAVLHFAVEFATNTSHRIHFAPSSANGILLFRFCSELLVKIAPSLMNHDPSSFTEDLWGHKYKIVWLCISLLRACFYGKYVCFGVFSLYNDPALFRALQVVLDLCFSIPLEVMATYTKLEKSFFELAQHLSQDHLHTLLEMKDKNYVVNIVHYVKEGLGGPHMEQICHTLQYVCEGYYKLKKKRRNNKENDILMVFEQQVISIGLLPSILARLMHLIIFEEFKYHYYLANALLSIIVVFPEHYEALKQQVISSQGAESRGDVEAAFFELTKEVGLDMEERNQTRFMQNLSRFRHSVEKVIHPID